MFKMGYLSNFNIKTEMCRVCLKSEKDNMFPLNETFINSYNLLTNLNISLADGMPQCCCQTCIDTIKYFIEFREKSITSETTLRDVFFKPGVKVERHLDVDETSKECIKNETLEIKQENNDSIMDGFNVDFETYDEDISLLFAKNEEEKDIKPKKLKKKLMKSKFKAKGKHDSAKNKSEEVLINNSDKLACGVCPMSFDNRDSLYTHLATHQTDSRCNLCKEEVNSYSQLLGHRLKHVAMNQFNCHICNKRFRVPLYLEYHYRTMHIHTDEPHLTCKLCLQKYKTPKRLRNHTREVHSDKNYLCDICSKSYHSKATLKSHMKSHNNKKTYVCDLCGFSCKQSSNLRDHHIRKHIKHRQYCKYCRRPFPSQERLDSHKCPGTKYVICPICGLTFGSNMLNTHIRKHSNDNFYECKRCPAKFKTKGALVVHNNRHDGNRTHQCQYCEAKFYSQSVLIKHRRIHTGEKPYVCKICKKGFTGGHNLKVHMKVHGEYLVVKKDSEPDLTLNIVKII